MSQVLRQKITIEGRVQGVGFRPHVFHLAQEFHLNGVVYNLGSSVVIEIQGELTDLDKFKTELRSRPPINARVERIAIDALPIHDKEGFSIAPSCESLEGLHLPNDFAICKDCLLELRDPSNRRFQYPFTSCAVCGPRWSLLEALPYDRCHTTMKEFFLCDSCQSEFSSPLNRRFHAQTMSCPACGPKVSVLDGNGHLLAEGSAGICKAAELILQGSIVAVKGVGGFQLWCRADSSEVVQRLRLRKRRKRKAFALMVEGIASARELCEVSSIEEQCLQSIEAPIVLLERKPKSYGLICDEIAPGLSELGLMLPCTPLHYLLFDHIKRPVVATSANLTDEPLATETDEAVLRLSGIADYFLTDNRRIVRAVDDSVVRFVGGRLQMLRLARGYAPAVFRPRGLGLGDGQNTVQCFGADLKSSLCFQKDSALVVSQHLGELGSATSILNFEKTYKEFAALLSLSSSSAFLRDGHPDLISSRLAPVDAISVQHHRAHFFSAFVEHDIRAPAIGIVWDGTGLGSDHQIWGGEFFCLSEGKKLNRVASLWPFAFFGGDAFIKDTRRIAFSLLAEVGLLRSELFRFTEEEILVWSQMVSTTKTTTTSMGRLFDGIYALITLSQNQYSPPSYEGEHAILLEELALSWRQKQTISEHEEVLNKCEQPSYRFGLTKVAGGFLQVDWRPMIREIVRDIQSCHEFSKDSQLDNLGRIADCFQRTLVQVSVAVVKEIDTDLADKISPQVVLAGGCFQNRFLLTQISKKLSSLGHSVVWPEFIPLHDGGISAGQACSYSFLKI